MNMDKMKNTKYHTGRTVSKYHTGRTVSKYHTGRTVSKSNRKISETSKIYTSNITFHFPGLVQTLQ
jgi:hypothetical protein